MDREENDGEMKEGEKNKKLKIKQIQNTIDIELHFQFYSFFLDE